MSIFYCYILLLDKCNSYELSPCNKIWILNFIHLYSCFCFSQKFSYSELFILWRSISVQNVMVPCWLVQVFHPPQKFEHPPFWNDWSYGIKTYGEITSLLNFMKMYQLIQKLLVEERQTDKQTAWWSHKPHFIFNTLSTSSLGVYLL
jgi:hypothetical protein